MARQVASGSLPPSGTGWQLPAIPATAHEVQLGQVDEPQHTCSTQWPLMQSVSAPQAFPLASWFVHEPLAHEKPVAQSPSPAQVVRQAAPAPQR